MLFVLGITLMMKKMHGQENGETSTSEATNKNKGTFFQDLVFCQINVWVYTFRQRFPISSSSYIV